MVKTYLKNSPKVELKIFPAVDGQISLKWMEENLDENVAAVVLQSPNVFGVIEDIKAVSSLVKKKVAKIIFGKL